jgi:hypothetical protein
MTHPYGIVEEYTQSPLEIFLNALKVSNKMDVFTGDYLLSVILRLKHLIDAEQKNLWI